MKKNRYILVALLIVLLGTYILLRMQRPEEKLRLIYDLDTLSIAQIEVFDSADTLKLEKQKGVWYLVEPLSWQADTLRVNTLFRNVFTARFPQTPMGEGTEAIKRFKLQDSEALHIKIADKNGSRTIHTLFSNMGNPFDYFRYAGSDKIYQIKTKVFNTFNTNVSSWRSPHVVRYDEAELQKIEVYNRKNIYTLTRKEYDWHYKNQSQNFVIPRNNLAIMKIVNLLANFDTYVFVDNGDKQTLDNFADPVCTVKLTLSQNRTQELVFARYDETQFALMVDGNQNVLYVVSNDALHRFTRTADIFKLRGYGI